MLQVTEAAAKVLKSTVRESDAPDDAGVRFVPEPDKPGALGIEILETPEAGDQVVEESGVRIFLPEELADELADRTLDIDVTEQGVALTLR
jgi:Fe-S cluster assembly iron-binding protein IscA